MTKSVLLKTDDGSEMAELYINGKLWREGNFWDFSLIEDLPSILEKLGIECTEEDYKWGEEEDEDEEV
jgi:hypothetical protein